MQTRSITRLAAVGTAAALMLVGLSACGNKSNGSASDTTTPADSAGSAAGSTAAGGGGGLGGGGDVIKIAFQGPLSGDNAQLGINEDNDFKLAVEQANAKGDLGFTLETIEADDQGDPAIAPAAAAKVLQDSAVVGVVGPSFSGATKAVGKPFGDAGLTFITPSATNPTLSQQGFTTFHRIVPSDNVEGTQGADWLVAKGEKSVYVIDDLSDYGKGVADAVETELKAKGVTVARNGVDAKTTDYTATAQTVASSGATALFYGGYDAQAALLAKALKAANYTGITVTGNGGKSTVFTKNAGDAGDGWYFTCGCLDATTAPDAKAFNDAYKAKFGTDSSTYSPEAYDATNALIQAIKDAKAKGDVTRASVNTAVNALDYKGITTEVKFESSGEVSASVQTVNLYQQESGAIALVGNIKDQK